MRKTYVRSDETFHALIGHESDIAKEMECDPSYIFNIKNGEKKDPFPPFREIYRATARGGGDTSHWRHDLDAIDASVKSVAAEEDLFKLLLNKVDGEHLSTKETIRAISDGCVDESEAHRLIQLLTKVKENATKAIEQLVLHKARLRGEFSRGPRIAA